ncbi:hypothetical protein QPK13_23175 [Photorhabdus tasmaniensis]
MREMIGLMHATVGARDTVNPVKMVGIFLLTLGTVSPFLVAIYTLIGHFNMGTINQLAFATQWAGAVAAVLLFLIYAYLSWKHRHFWYTGAAIASVLVAFIFGNSLFFVSDKATGVLATFILGDGGNKDIECDRPAMLVHYTKGVPTDWRCPTGIMLMSDSSRPFVPWPDYHQGSSASLTAAIDIMMENAAHQNQ